MSPNMTEIGSIRNNNDIYMGIFQMGVSQRPKFKNKIENKVIIGF